MTVFRIVLAPLSGLLALVALAAPATAATLLTEDFQSHVDGGLVAGTNGWTGDVVHVNASSAFGGSLVLDGTDYAGTVDGFAQVRHGLGGNLDGAATSSLSVDVYAQTASLPSHNNGLGLGSSANSGVGAGGVYWLTLYDKDNVAGRTGYFFDARGLTGGSSDYFAVDGPFNTVLDLQIVLDGAAGEVYGVYDFGGGLTETTHFAVTAAQIQTIDQVFSFVDFRSANVGGVFASTGRGTRFGGAQWDNISVEGQLLGQVPEPATLAVFAVGLVGLRLSRRRRS